MLSKIHAQASQSFDLSFHLRCSICLRVFVLDIMSFDSMIWLYLRQPNRMHVCICTALYWKWFDFIQHRRLPTKRYNRTQCTDMYSWFLSRRLFPSAFFHFILMLILFFWWQSDLVAVIFGCCQLCTEWRMYLAKAPQGFVFAHVEWQKN